MQNPLFYKLEKINRKWVFRIMFIVFENEKVGFNYIKKALKPITSKVLSNRLKTLEDMALVTKKIVVDKPLKVEYYLTKKGKRMISAIVKSLRE
ncbi:MAG: helix-turn-helix domain-containing protein [Candidatus Aenigmatarchaeota archaeon]